MAVDGYGSTLGLNAGVCALNLHSATKENAYFQDNEVGSVTYLPFKQPIDKISFSPSGKYMMVINSDSEIELQNADNLDSDRYKHHFKSKGSKVMHLAVDWEHLKVVAAYDDKIIKIYDLKAGQEG